ncbi:hypothetical protein ColTof4_13578 [Colletotrichum tofieldiae]|nr:hypothetical protein ColTof4_13578 [Colletotrichum tofieldiae]GKT97334.1 hypothetical protein Ct61P_15184 [Colletotrichum tofieldiae]
MYEYLSNSMFPIFWNLPAPTDTMKSLPNDTWVFFILKDMLTKLYKILETLLLLIDAMKDLLTIYGLLGLYLTSLATRCFRMTPFSLLMTLQTVNLYTMISFIVAWESEYLTSLTGLVVHNPRPYTSQPWAA